MSHKPPGESKKLEFFESTLEVLDKLRQQEGRGPEEIAALESAAKALNYLFMLGRLDGFLDYLQDLNRQEVPAEGSEPSFARMSEAMDWLHSQPEPRHGALVRVSGTSHVVVRQRTETWLLIPAPPLPSLQELEEED